MKPPKDTHAPRPGYGEIHADSLYPLREVGRRLGWGNRTIAQAQRDGLRAVQYGRLKYTTGLWVRAFIEQQAAQQTEQGGATP